MTRVERNLREILAHTQHQLRKDDERFSFDVSRNELMHRYEATVLLGRKRFEEVYCLSDSALADERRCKGFYESWYKSIKTNLNLFERMYRLWLT